jgi:hypothetical protein
VHIVPEFFALRLTKKKRKCGKVILNGTKWSEESSNLAINEPFGFLASSE